MIASYQELILLFQITLYAIAALSAICAIVGIVFSSWWLSEKMRMIKADRIEREKSAHVTVVSNNGQTWIRDTDKNAEWKNLSDTPLWRVNGEDRLPNEVEMQIYKQRLLTQNRQSKIEQLPAKIEDDRPEALFDLLESYPHIMLTGGTGSGKTTQINHCIEYHLRQDERAKIVWLSTHVALDAKQNNIHPKAIPFQSASDIAKVLTDLFETYKKRRDNAGEYSRIVICLDEWPEIVAEIDIDTTEFLRRMSIGTRKTNINLILASFGATIKDLDSGSGGVKYNFAQVELHPRMTQQNKAYWLNGRERVEIALPGIFRSYSKPRLVKLQFPSRMSDEQKWLKLVQSGMSKNEACLQVYGRSFAGNLVSKLNGYMEKN